MKTMQSQRMTRAQYAASAIVADAHPDGFGLRAQTAADRVFCEALFSEQQEGLLRSVGWDAAQCRDYLEPQFAMRESNLHADYPAADYRIIQAGDVDIGRLVINRGPRRMQLLELVLQSDWRNHGIGSYWLGWLCDEADAAAIWFELQVAFDNRAVKLYLEFGFEVAASDGMYLRMRRSCKPAFGPVGNASVKPQQQRIKG